ncbi:biotin-dependent carboxyltransferase family protein [Roseibaca sp. Y0-43]|uniref:5-oxoprolinase subunit C family protein n=1 Tax=Roseibaca sp. Y0-43 TaxID=2816854 RepID=UPI001D0C0071|nr:biotin-dependent carboxyltransferase family protein [Roseibaca sp. Y0-43]MCC1480065.1 biotin-dependent carboxyltransferase family protein [Roseibaca sp. Y0-43]
MTRAITIHAASPGVSVQDKGRPGYLAQGLSRGGAADLLALAEGAALLGQSDDLAVLELAGGAITLSASDDMRVALTGADMRATLDGAPLVWGASHALPKGAVLKISPSRGGFGYVHLGGGLDAPVQMGARGAHLAAGLGQAVQTGDTIAVGPDTGHRTGLCLPAAALDTTLRLVPSLQTALFGDAALARLEATPLTKDARGNRMGQRLVPEGEGFATETGLSILSETIVPGDVQITGDGMPYVLLSECQTTGGYPRIGTVLPADLPKLLRAGPGTVFRARFIPLDEAAALERAEAKRRAGLSRSLQPLLRDPRDIPDLLRYQLVSGVTAGNELEEC